MSPPRFGDSIGGVGLRWFPREPTKTCSESCCFGLGHDTEVDHPFSTSPTLLSPTSSKIIQLSTSGPTNVNIFHHYKSNKLFVYIVYDSSYTSFHIFPSHSSPFLPLTTVLSTTSRSRFQAFFVAVNEQPGQEHNIKGWNWMKLPTIRFTQKRGGIIFSHWHYLFIKHHQTCLWTELEVSSAISFCKSIGLGCRRYSGPILSK